MKSGAMAPLVQLLHSDNVEVQCNTCGCITTLATTGTLIKWFKLYLQVSCHDSRPWG